MRSMYDAPQRNVFGGCGDSRAGDLAQLESSAIDIGHGCMVEALGLALEALDARLLAQKTEGISVHDVRSRTLATEIGDVGFSLRRYRDRFGEDVYLLADALDIPYGCRSSHAIGRQTAQRRRPACTTSVRPSAQAGRALFRGNTPRIALAALIAVALVALVAIAFARCGKDTPENEAAPAVGTAARVSFVAVGDNLPEARITAYADALAGTTGDGDFDFPPIYEPVKPIVETADLAYIKQETHIGGKEIGARGWPSFNTVDQMADAVVATGFDLVASASNHSYDWGAFGAVEHSRSIWDGMPVVFTGTAASQEQADELALIERDGITFALLDYTYGVNGFTQADLPSYAVNFIDDERIIADVARAREAADVVLAAMHWGTENLLEADEEQQRLAQLLADAGVDVVLGSHPHVIGPLAWVEGAGGNKTLVAYSLGNFLSCHETPDAENELEGMLSCDFVKGDDGAVAIENVVWTPLVNHTAEGEHLVVPLKDYTADMAARHVLFSQSDDPAAAIEQLKATNRAVIGEEFAIDDGAQYADERMDAKQNPSTSRAKTRDQGESRGNKAPRAQNIEFREVQRDELSSWRQETWTEDPPRCGRTEYEPR